MNYVEYLVKQAGNYFYGLPDTFLALKRYVYEDSKLQLKHELAVARVYKISHPADCGPDADFEYCVDAIMYRDFTSFNTNKYKIKAGDRFLLKCHPANPKIARILLDCPLDSAGALQFKNQVCP